MLDRGGDTRAPSARRELASPRGSARPSAIAPGLGGCPFRGADTVPDPIVGHEPVQCPGQAFRPLVGRARGQHGGNGRLALDRALQVGVRGQDPLPRRQVAVADPSGCVARRVGPASSNRSHGRVGWTARRQDRAPDAEPAQNLQQRTLVRRPGPAALNQAAPRSVGMRIVVAPRPHVRLLDRPGDPPAEPRKLAVLTHASTATRQAGSQPGPDAGRDRLPASRRRVSGPCRRRTGSRRRPG